MKEKFKRKYEGFNSHKIIIFILSIIIILITLLPFIAVLIPNYLKTLNIPYWNDVYTVSGNIILFVFPYLIPIILISVSLYYKDYYILKIVLFLAYFLSIYFQVISTMGIYMDEDLKFFLYRYIIPNGIFIIIFIIVMVFKSKSLKIIDDIVA